MHNPDHPDFDILFNYFSATPAWTLNGEEIDLVTKHVDVCKECSSFGATIHEYDALWESTFSAPYTELEAETLDADLELIRHQVRLF
ncbi:MAG: hypothetical protein ABR568_15025 [Pyrinomonadaceae bacterium]